MTLGFTVVPGTLTTTDFLYNARHNGMKICPHQRLTYNVQEDNGAQFQATILWNSIEWDAHRYPLSTDQSEMLRQATLREKQYRGITLTVDELYVLRYPEALPDFRIISRTAISPPTPVPAPAPIITPAAITETLTLLQSQIATLTADVISLRKQLQEAISDKERLTEQLAKTQVLLLSLTDSFRKLLTQ